MSGGTNRANIQRMLSAFGLYLIKSSMNLFWLWKIKQKTHVKGQPIKVWMTMLLEVYLFVPLSRESPNKSISTLQLFLFFLFFKVTRVSESLSAHRHTPPNKYACPLCCSAPLLPTPHPMSRKGMPTRPHPRAERRLKPDEWSSGTACSLGPYFTPQSLIKTRCGTSWAKAAYSGLEKDICLQWHSGRGGNGAKVTAKASAIGSHCPSRGFLDKAEPVPKFPQSSFKDEFD